MLVKFNQTCTNKDHHKMMVDPIFIIVQNVRSFGGTAVTPTAVPPTVVLLLEFTWFYLTLHEFTWILLNLTDITSILTEFTWICLNWNDSQEVT